MKIREGEEGGKVSETTNFPESLSVTPHAVVVEKKRRKKTRKKKKLIICGGWAGGKKPHFLFSFLQREVLFLLDIASTPTSCWLKGKKKKVMRHELRSKKS